MKEIKVEKWEDYWTHIYENYLLADLRRLVALPPQTSGGLNFVITLTTLVGMELTGKLIEGAWNGDDGIETFVLSRFYKATARFKRADLAKILKEALRNGLAHSFMPRPTLAIWRGNPTYHCRVLQIPGLSDYLIHFDADELYREFEAAATKYHNTLLQDEKDSSGERYRSKFIKCIRESQKVSEIEKRFVKTYRDK